MSLKQQIKIAKRNSRITPKVTAWLMAHDGVKLDDPLTTQRVLEILSPSTHDRSGVFHPSQLYECQRKQVFEFYGVPTRRQFNPTLQNLFNDGHFRHLRWQIMLLNAGILTDIEVSVSIPEQRLAGSMDGANFTEGWMFELKGTSQFGTISANGALPQHVKQVQAYLMASGLDSAVVLYEDKSSQQWLEIEINRDVAVIDEIRGILSVLNRAVDDGVMPEVLDECANQTGRFARCPYADRCLSIAHRDDIAEIL